MTKAALQRKSRISSKHRDIVKRWRKWLILEAGGMNANQIAEMYGLSKTTVYYGIKRAKEIIELYGDLV